MGRGKEKRRRFLAENPYCCFCGGSAPTTEVDHFPARAFFRDRSWPEGLEFPSCFNCNHVSSKDELLVAWLSRARIRGDSMSSTDVREFKDLLDGVKREFPGLIENMKASTTHRVRREAKKTYNLELPEGASLLDVPVVSVTDPRVQDAIFNVGRKLALALYYKHFKIPLSPGGGVGVVWYSNVQMDKGDVPPELAALLTEFPSVKRGNADLSDQFFYRFRSGEKESKRMASFLAGFHTSFAVVGFMSDVITELQIVVPGGVARAYPPYRWP
jgi:hypothetical protein